jgi:hypothetical protein
MFHISGGQKEEEKGKGKSKTSSVKYK